VKLWSLQNQQLAATVSQFHSSVFEVFAFRASSESLRAKSKENLSVFEGLAFAGIFAHFSQRIERTAISAR